MLASFTASTRYLETPAARPPRRYEAHVQQWRDLRALTEDDAMALHEAACEHAGRELMQAEARALLRRQ